MSTYEQPLLMGEMLQPQLPLPDTAITTGNEPLGPIEAAQADSAYWRMSFLDASTRVVEQQGIISTLDYLATRNPVSNLYNERGFRRRFDEATKTEPDTQRALVSIDLGSFKDVNDVLGHHAGDELLRQVGQGFRESDFETIVANPHGDEFIVCTALTAREEMPLTNTERLEAIIRRLKLVAVELNTQRPELNELGFSISAGGVVITPGMTLDEALKLSDTAMYNDKRANLVPLSAEESRRVAAIRQYLAEMGMSYRKLGKYIELE